MPAASAGRRSGCQPVTPILTGRRLNGQPIGARLRASIDQRGSIQRHYGAYFIVPTRLTRTQSSTLFCVRRRRLARRATTPCRRLVPRRWNAGVDNGAEDSRRAVNRILTLAVGLTTLAQE